MRAILAVNWIPAKHVHKTDKFPQEFYWSDQRPLWHTDIHLVNHLPVIFVL